jgi:hypothetical protein
MPPRKRATIALPPPPRVDDDDDENEFEGSDEDVAVDDVVNYSEDDEDFLEEARQRALALCEADDLEEDAEKAAKPADADEDADPPKKKTAPKKVYQHPLHKRWVKLE